jgi:hypothetical protein
MLLRSLLLLVFSSQVFSAGITIDVDLQMTIDEIRYVDDSDEVEDVIDDTIDEPIFIDLVISSDCPDIQTESEESSDINGETDNELVGLLGDLGFSVKTETRTVFGTAENSYSSHYDGNWSIYDDARGKLIRNWDEDCSHAPRDISVETNIQDIDYVELYKELNTVYIGRFSTPNYVAALGEPSNIDWARGLPPGFFKVLDTINGRTYAKIESGTDTGLWVFKPEIKKLMTTSLESNDKVINTNAGVVGYSVDPPVDGSIKLEWLEQDTNKTYSYTTALANTYELYPLAKGTVLAADSENGWKFQWLNHGEKEKIIVVPAGVNEFFNCQLSSNNLFCLDKRDNGEVLIWRLLVPFWGNPTFVVDSVMSAEVLPLGAEIHNFYYLDGYRVLFTTTENENGVVIVDSDSANYSVIKNEFYYFKTKDAINQYLQLKDNVFSVISVTQENLPAFVYSLVASADVIEEDNDNPSDEVVEEPEGEPKEELLEEREDTSSEEDEPRPRAELSGAVSMYYLFAMMLVLLVGRRKA